MKNLLLSIVALFLLGLTNVNAQGFKGKWFILGQAGYGTEADGNVKNYSILPVVGTFVAPTTAIGLGVGYMGGEIGKKDDKTTTGTFIVQPLARQYWGVSDKFFIFGQASVPLGFGKNTEKVAGVKTDEKFTTYGIKIEPGIDYFLSSNFSIEASFGLVGWSAYKPKDGDTTNDFDIHINSGFLNGVKFGIKYVF